MKGAAVMTIHQDVPFLKLEYPINDATGAGICNVGMGLFGLFQIFTLTLHSGDGNQMSWNFIFLLFALIHRS